MVSSFYHRSLDTTSNNSNGETEKVKFAFYVSTVIFIILLLTFELIRHIKQIFLKRITRKFQKSKRVPPVPPRYFFGWIVEIMKVSESDFLYMVGLDGYVFLRFIKLCLKISCFFTLWGLLILLPVYVSSSGDQHGWSKYTLANAMNEEDSHRLWLPAVFSYVFSGYVCRLFYLEYQLFVKMRLEYLIRGDPDTHPQTYYTLMVEDIPRSLRSGPTLRTFFDTLFPDSVHSVSLSLKLHRLEALVDRRRKTRNTVEVTVARQHAKGKPCTLWVPSNFYEDTKTALYKMTEECGEGVEEKGVATVITPDDIPIVARRCGFIQVHAVPHYMYVLQLLNQTVRTLQIAYITRTNELNAIEEQSLQDNPDSMASHVLQYLVDEGPHQSPLMQRHGGDARILPTLKLSVMSRRRSESADSDGGHAAVQLADRVRSKSVTRQESEYSVEDGAPLVAPGTLSSSDNIAVHADKSTEDDDRGAVALWAESFLADSYEITRKTFAAETERTAALARQGALEARRQLAFLTGNDYFNISSTAFVTFTSRVSAGVAHQMLLSHENHQMQVNPAPSFTDIIWKNVYIKRAETKKRTRIAGALFVLGAIFWSFVVTGIRRIFNLQTFDKKHESFLVSYEGTMIYTLFNDYMAVAILLCLLAVLPLIFDFVARQYERLRTENDIQKSIMGRYYYYMLANVYINVTADTIFRSMETLVRNPGDILEILGESLPNVSAFFASMIILYTFVGLMVEFIRAWPMVCFYSVTMFTDKRKCTRRQLRTGAFAAARMLYGWIYPCLLMVFMIIMIYSCIAPMICLLAVVYFAFAYLMYKYQLLYVYVNEYQSGGHMWYSVFDMSMMALLCGNVTLLGYLVSKKELIRAPFYIVAPLPALITLFWRRCNERFYGPSNLSLQHAGIIDKHYRDCAARMRSTPVDSFNERAYHQPSLTEPYLAPEPYRLRSAAVGAINTSGHGGATYNTLHTQNDSITNGTPLTSERRQRNSINLDTISESVAREASDDDIDQEEADNDVNDILEGLTDTNIVSGVV